ncbi:metallophosphoesterase [Magnetococcus marinus MC-1]|uniref:Metallophosphoesterase n=1 Tax=Magnetococcus marinus (strain ATCC BAA-1437 / JCM 17883 / MC-1) TaxID=156889 RepID=A0LDI1_MAGMM|nr:DNA repair exonuclease [Magnetococcus marinus]ABK46024.1 metallophosphoesterase [Magnetococcus marinus MC-1]
MNFTFIHCADIHLDSPMQGLDAALRKKLPPNLLENLTRNAWNRLVDEAISKQVAFVAVAGDLYDGDWKDYRTGHFLAGSAKRLHQANIPLIILLGNHDAQSKLTKKLSMPPNVTILDHHKPQTILLHDLHTAIHGWSYPHPAISENMVIHYPPAHPEYFNVGLLHTAMDGREGHDPYAPCHLNDLLTLNYDYWGLGHAHRFEQLNQTPPICYSGNLQGRHIRETGTKGYLLLQVDKQTVTEITHCPVHTLRWEQCTIALTEQDESSWLKAIRHQLQQLDPNQPTLVRLTLQGHSPLFRDRDRLYAECEAAAQEIHDQLWIEQVKMSKTTQPQPLGTDSGHTLLNLANQLSQSPQQQQLLRDALLEQMRGPAKKRLEILLQEGALNNAIEDGLAQLEPILNGDNP